MAIKQSYKTNDLFKPDQNNFWLNACVGKNGGPYGFDSYAIGYFDSAESTADAIILNKIRVDLAIYPLTYLYRHAMELSIKYLVELLPKIWNESQNYKMNHDLKDNWEHIVPYLRKDPDFDNVGNIDFVEKIIKDIVEFDPTAEVFRFPTNRKGKFYLQDSAHINVGILQTAMCECRTIFEYWFNLGREKYYSSSS